MSVAQIVRPIPKIFLTVKMLVSKTFWVPNISRTNNFSNDSSFLPPKYFVGHKICSNIFFAQIFLKSKTLIALKKFSSPQTVWTRKFFEEFKSIFGITTIFGTNLFSDQIILCHLLFFGSLLTQCFLDPKNIGT